MDTFEIISSIRNIVGLHSESELGTQELLRALNVAYVDLVEKNYAGIKSRLNFTEELSSQSGNVDIPENLDYLVNLYRKDSDDNYQLCREISLDNAGAIGTINYPSDDAKNPIFVDYGDHYVIHPTPSSTDVKLEYHRKLPALFFNRGLSLSTLTIQIEQPAPIIDDHLNGVFVGLYTLSDGILSLDNENKITDYVGSTRTATLKNAITDATTYYIAIYPLRNSLANSLIKNTVNFLNKTGKADVRMFRERVAQIPDEVGEK